MTKGPEDAGADPLIAAAAARLKDAGIDAPRREARLLLGHVMDMDPGRFFAWPETICPPAARAAFDALVTRRIAGEPVSHLTGRREFWSLQFRVSPAVLDPRPDSETLVEQALRLFPDTASPLRVLDLGTGSGCLLLSVLSERPRASGVGVDLSADALAVAQVNAADLGIGGRAVFVRSDWFGAVRERFDLVLCNPPYVPENEIASLQKEVRAFEPRGALDGGPDGLDPYRLLLPRLADFLLPGGYALFEVGAGQADEVSSIGDQPRLRTIAEAHDLSGHPRCLIFQARQT